MATATYLGQKKRQSTVDFILELDGHEAAEGDIGAQIELIGPGLAPLASRDHVYEEASLGQTSYNLLETSRNSTRIRMKRLGEYEHPHGLAGQQKLLSLVVDRWPCFTAL